MHQRLCTAVSLGVLAAASAPFVWAQSTPFGHAHNDYYHPRPLLDALDHGFVSVEADVFLVDGEILVGHDRHELTRERTLEALYLAPLAERVRQNGGSVHGDDKPFYLFIDIKADGLACYDRLHRMLAARKQMLTTVRDGEVSVGAITVVISGDRPIETIAAQSLRYAGIDGRLTDLDSDAPAHLMPVISDRWPSHFAYRGEGPMPSDQAARLSRTVAKAHAAGRVVRFWATPESEALWIVLLEAGVDLINTDQLARLRRFAESVDE